MHSDIRLVAVREGRSSSSAEIGCFLKNSFNEEYSEVASYFEPSTISFAVVGGVFALVLRGMPFTISAGAGFIALFGVALITSTLQLGGQLWIPLYLVY